MTLAELTVELIEMLSVELFNFEFKILNRLVVEGAFLVESASPPPPFKVLVVDVEVIDAIEG